MEKEKIGEISGRLELGYISWFISKDFEGNDCT